MAAVSGSTPSSATPTPSATPDTIIEVNGKKYKVTIETKDPQGNWSTDTTARIDDTAKGLIELLAKSYQRVKPGAFDTRDVTFSKEALSGIKLSRKEQNTAFTVIHNKQPAYDETFLQGLDDLHALYDQAGKNDEIAARWNSVFNTDAPNPLLTKDAFLQKIKDEFQLERTTSFVADNKAATEETEAFRKSLKTAEELWDTIFERIQPAADRSPPPPSSGIRVHFQEVPTPPPSSGSGDSGEAVADALKARLDALRGDAPSTAASDPVEGEGGSAETEDPDDLTRRLMALRQPTDADTSSTDPSGVAPSTTTVEDLERRLRDLRS